MDDLCGIYCPYADKVIDTEVEHKDSCEIGQMLKDAELGDLIYKIPMLPGGGWSLIYVKTGNMWVCSQSDKQSYTADTPEDAIRLALEKHNGGQP